MLYDINPPIVIIEYPLNDGYFNAPKFTYSTNEQLKEAIITISRVGGPDDPNSRIYLIYHQHIDSKVLPRS